MKRRTTVLLTALMASTAWPPAYAQSSTHTYTYDAKGRLVKVQRQGGVNNGKTTEYERDKADNRKRVRST